MMRHSQFGSITLNALLGIGTAAGIVNAQVPPAPGAPEVTASRVSGTIKQFNYNRDAEINGFLLNNNTLVQLPPLAAARADMLFRLGDNVQVSGSATPAAGGMQTVVAESVQDRSSGKQFVAAQPGAPAPYSITGKIKQLNYGPGGSVNGFLLENGTFASVPPFSSSNPSAIQVGAAVTVGGYARATPSGKTAVEAQTLTVNGQQLALSAVPPPAGPRGRRGPGAGPRATRGPAPIPPSPGDPAVAPPPPGRADQPAPPPPPSTTRSR